MMDEFYVIDYDIPKNPKLRTRFYRAIKKYFENVKNGGYVKYSTQSVVITDDPNLADYIFTTAISVGGKARLFIAKQIRSWQDVEVITNISAGKISKQVSLLQV